MTQASDLGQIANQPGALYRTRVNTNVQALASFHGGTTAPDPVHPNMLWFDSGSGRVKLRDPTNTAWSTVGLIGPPFAWTATIFRDVLSYGARGDGVTDDTAAIQSAIAAASAGTGGEVYFPAGQYKISAALTVDHNGVHLRGAGSLNTEILCATAGQDGVVFGNGTTARTHLGVSDMAFNVTGVTKTGGAAVRTNYVQWAKICDLRIANHFYGVRMTRSVLVLAQRIEIIDPVTTLGIGVLIDGAVPSNDHYLRDIMVSAPSTDPAYGFAITNTGGTWLDSCGGLMCVNGIGLIPASGETVEHLFSSRCGWDTCTAHGMLIQPAAGGQVRRCTFIGDWTATNGQYGVITAGAGTIQGLQFIGHRSINNQFHGFSIGAGTNILVQGATCAGNGGAASNTYDGIAVGVVSGFRLQGNRCGAVDGFTNIQRYGISVNSAASANFIITGNDCLNNLTGGILNLGTTPSVVANNL